MFHVVLVHPEIPPNTGNVIRLCANTGAQLHLIKPLGFNLDDKHMRRAGLDYHEYAHLHIYENWQDFTHQHPQARLFALSTKGTRYYHEVSIEPDDFFVFGSETAGLPSAIRDTFPATQLLRLPMRENQRSLNLSNSVAVVVFEAWRQHQFQMGL
jgi:tRNA (cytidine/uridine-2'-O-)-methyltransferase